MKDVLTYLVEHIVTEPKKVSIEESGEEGEVTFFITCDPLDTGRIIGKKGKVIKALRKVLSILAIKEGKRVNISMVTEESQEPQEVS
jgi:uncharacterized protein